MHLSTWVVCACVVHACVDRQCWGRGTLHGWVRRVRPLCLNCIEQAKAEKQGQAAGGGQAPHRGRAARACPPMLRNNKMVMQKWARTGAWRAHPAGILGRDADVDHREPRDGAPAGPAAGQGRVRHAAGASGKTGGGNVRGGRSAHT